ncbi:aminoacyl-tRNA hydrolase [Thioflexithrix psekupsensis]|uniref:Peptidyl-tRNA hydrolase n=1 Tax=Thioflexithrix psekupsensis TaxID=1570016 RepID=A0A251X9Y9_9GAMM|nr:aminoacyl-tRNA hydrolase [Thioflexithrix psekupsensis]OUD15035.1 aminoacyl-tRNA hydrolase [Thioflexithrix psekupsensis]
MSIGLVVGLGNPGGRYANTRHNAGFWFVDAVARDYRLSFRTESRFSGEVARIQTADIDCWLLKPQTFMNRSGVAIQAMAQFYKIPVNAILVAHDELDLSPGTVRLKVGGGHGGHNGLRDTVQQLASAEFSRLRLGIGHPGHRDQVVDYVLSAPTDSDRHAMDEAITRSLAVIPLLFAGEFNKAMQQLHR